ncbi:MAG: hypothetical protein OWU32_00180 [Firmicutes bacterium]|nr:hypothetical protein [Bacillota bacterium]
MNGHEDIQHCFLPIFLLFGLGGAEGAAARGPRGRLRTPFVGRPVAGYGAVSPRAPGAYRAYSPYGPYGPYGQNRGALRRPAGPLVGRRP